MGFNQSSSFRDIEITELATVKFTDSRGHNFEVTYDALSGEVIELDCWEPKGNVRITNKGKLSSKHGAPAASRLNAF